MVDIETLGLDVGSAILSIGAVRFSAGTVDEWANWSVSLESCQEHGLEMDAGTLEWWLDQGEEANHVLSGGMELGTVLTEFAEWFGDADEIWANSPSFDCEMLEHAYAQVGLVEPWEFYQERDFRTLDSLSVAPEMEQEGVEHDALADAVYQAKIASETLARIDGENNA
jgi:hypothetical protein